MASPAIRKVSKLQVAGIFTGTLLSLGAIVLLVFLANEEIGPYPYLTPFAHFLATIVQPLIPLVAPFTLGMAIKFFRYNTKELDGGKAFPKKKTWVWMYSLWSLQHLIRVFDSGKAIYRGNARVGQCVEVGLLLLVVMGEGLDIKWEGGLLDKWVEQIAEGARQAEALRAAKKLEQGEISPVAAADEKVAFVAEERVFPTADQEKRALMTAEV